MRILGLCFAGTSTEHRAEMRAFVDEVLGLPSVVLDGVEADFFELPDGSTFGVASPGGMGETGRSIGFLVDDLDAALDELRARGIETDPEPAITRRCATPTSSPPTDASTSWWNLSARDVRPRPGRTPPGARPARLGHLVKRRPAQEVRMTTLPCGCTVST